MRAAVDLFYRKLLKDPELRPFFEEASLGLMKMHQYNFMKMAFTEVPKGWDIAEFIAAKHAHLFEKGLNVKHFDLTIGHLAGALQELAFSQTSLTTQSACLLL